MFYLIVRLCHHKTLVPGEMFPDMSEPGLHLFYLFHLLPLHQIRLAIQRQSEEIDHDTEYQNRQDRLFDQNVKHGKNHIIDNH